MSVVAFGEDVVHVLLDIADRADSSVFVTIDLVPVFADLVRVLRALPEEVPGLLGEVFVFGGYPYGFNRW